MTTRPIYGRVEICPDGSISEPPKPKEIFVESLV